MYTYLRFSLYIKEHRYIYMDGVIHIQLYLWRRERKRTRRDGRWRRFRFLGLSVPSEPPAVPPRKTYTRPGWG